MWIMGMFGASALAGDVFTDYEVAIEEHWAVVAVR